MNGNSWKWLNVLLNHYHSNEQDKLLRFLSEEDEATAREHLADSGELSPVCIQPHSFLDRVHYSWIAPILQKAPKEALPIYMNVLQQTQRAKLSKMLDTESRSYRLPSLVADMVKHHLFKQIVDRELLPPAFVPTNELSTLLNLQKQDLLSLADYLGLYDLAPEIRVSIDQRLRNQVFRLLSEDQRDYLMRIIHDKPEQQKISQTALLPAIQGQPDNAKKILHRRGLSFLGTALHGLHQDFLWYLGHILDAGRAKVLEQQFEKDVSLAPEKLSELRKEVLDLTNFLQQKGLM